MSVYISRWRFALLPLLVTPVFLGCVHSAPWIFPRVEISAGGGFTGLRNAEVGQRPAVDCDTQNHCTPVPGSLDLTDQSHYVWKPALATGLVFRWVMPYVKDDSTPDKRFGLGIGGQMVFAAQDAGTRLLPALTIHAGTSKTQLFFGLAFGASDVVSFPNGAKSIRVSSDAVTDFVQRNAGKKKIFFVGIVIDGLAVTGGKKP